MIRHGESRFNELNLFTGWLDVPLTEHGISEAQQAALHCKHYDYDAVFTSHLERAHETALVILSLQKKIGILKHKEHKWYSYTDGLAMHADKIIPIYADRTLNERAYGVLQGMNKRKAVEKFGETQVFKWRREFTYRPPQGESLRDVYLRVIPYFKKTILPRIRRGETILIVGHGNTLRTVIKFLENIDDHNISFVNLPFGRPLVYEFDRNAFKRIEGAYDFERPLR